jgi:polar amino acid transport system substrate-binding protein
MPVTPTPPACLVDGALRPKVLNRPFILFVCAALVCAAGPAARPYAAVPKEISLCADVWCPYNCAPGAPQPGFAVEIAQAAFAQSGTHVSYRPAAWARCVEDARAGRFTGIIAAIPADAPDFTFPREPIGISNSGYAVRKGDPFRYTGVSALEGRVLGTVRSYAFSGETGRYINAHAGDERRIEFVAGDDALQKNLSKLLAGRVDVVLDDDKVLRATIAALGLDSQVRVVRAPIGKPLFIAFSPASPDRAALARAFDSGIENLRADGKLATLMARYHLQDGS